MYVCTFTIDMLLKSEAVSLLHVTVDKNVEHIILNVARIEVASLDVC